MTWTRDSCSIAMGGPGVGVVVFDAPECVTVIRRELVVRAEVDRSCGYQSLRVWLGGQPHHVNVGEAAQLARQMLSSIVDESSDVIWTCTDLGGTGWTRIPDLTASHPRCVP